MLAVREIEEDQLSSELLCKLMADTGNSGLKIFTGKSKELKTKDIRAFTCCQLCLRTPTLRTPPPLGPPVVPGAQEIGLGPRTFAPGQTSTPEARPTGRAVSRERLGDWDGSMAV